MYFSTPYLFIWSMRNGNTKWERDEGFKVECSSRKNFCTITHLQFSTREKLFLFQALKSSSVLSVTFAQQIFWNKLRIDHKRLDEHDMNDGLYAFKSAIICWTRLIEADFLLEINHRGPAFFKKPFALLYPRDRNQLK